MNTILLLGIGGVLALALERSPKWADTLYKKHRAKKREQERTQWERRQAELRQAYGTGFLVGVLDERYQESKRRLLAKSKSPMLIENSNGEVIDLDSDSIMPTGKYKVRS